MSEEVTDRDRYPTLSEQGQRMLKFLREHPAAPIYRNQSGNRLTASDVEELRAFEAATLDAPIGLSRARAPEWLDAFVVKSFTEVPFYRALGSPPKRFADVPTCSRADLARDIAQFVPDTVDVARLINFRTTGTTGHPLLLASHPKVAARYLTFHKRALKRFGIELTHGSGQVGVVLVGLQRHCFTYVSVTPTMDESGLAKINLHPDDWRDPADRARYLDALAPEVYAGDPISFAALAELPLRTRPRALLSVSMTLTPALQQRLEERFSCPVLDLYSLNEAGPVGVFDKRAGGHVLLQPNLYVEILDESGLPVAPGERGEVTLTGGFNFCLPLLRYRTGDHAALAFTPEAPVLCDLAGRDAVRFRLANGEWINNIDVTHAFAAIPLPQFGVHQRSDGSLVLRVPRPADGIADRARSALETLFGGMAVDVEAISEPDKFLQYTSDLAGARV